MKKNIYILYFFILFNLVSCEEPTFEKISLNYVTFGESVAKVNESSTTSTLNGEVAVTNGFYTGSILRSSSDLSGALTVTISINSEFTDSTEYADAGDDASSSFELSILESVTIPSGKTKVEFTLTSVDDEFSSGNKVISLEIISVSDPSYEIGFKDGSISSDLTLEIVDDDCPIDIEKWAGLYSVEETFTSGVFLGSSIGELYAEKYQLEITIDATDASGTSAFIANSEGFNTFIDNQVIGENGLYAPVPFTFLTCSKEIVFATPVVIGLWSYMDFESTSYDESNYTITLIGELIGVGDMEIKFKKKD